MIDATFFLVFPPQSPAHINTWKKGDRTPSRALPMPVAPSAMMAVVTMMAAMAMVTIAMVTTMATSARAVPQTEGNGRADVIRHARIGRRPVRIRISRIAGVSRLINSASSQRGCNNQRKNQAFRCAFDMHIHGRQLDTIRFHNG